MMYNLFPATVNIETYYCSTRVNMKCHNFFNRFKVSVVLFYFLLFYTTFFLFERSYKDSVGYCSV